MNPYELEPNQYAPVHKGKIKIPQALDSLSFIMTLGINLGGGKRKLMSSLQS
jgi:hypothetical protein